MSGDRKPPSVERVSQLWRRVSDRKLAQWSIAYVAIAYAIQHGVILTGESLAWPPIIARVSMLLLAFGLPLVMLLAWYHGEHAIRQVSKVEFSIIALLLAVGSLWFYAFVQPAANTTAVSVPAVQQAGVAAARAASLSPRGAISIAVLPFANVSADPEQEFFSDGMTDEISGALAKIPDLRVVGRASAFQYKKRDSDLRGIGRALGATHLIEGSVRKAGNRVRITAELVKADDGLRVWSDSYDRDLTDVFAIQEDIAHAIAASLRMPLGLKPGENLVNSRTGNPALHEEYLHALALVRSRARGAHVLTEAVRRMDDVVARDPEFAPAWAVQALAYAYIPLFDPAVVRRDIEPARAIVADALPKGEAAARRAVRLDPENAVAYSALGFIQHVQGKQIEAMESMKKTMAIDPTNPDGFHLYSDLLADLGYVKSALPLRRQLFALEPFIPNMNGVTARIMLAAGDYDGVLANTDGTIAYTRSIPPLYRALAYAAQGRYAKAAENLRLLRNDPDLVQAAATLIQSAPAAPQNLPDLDRAADAELGLFYAFVGSPERVMARYESGLKVGYAEPGSAIFLWVPALANVRKTERFKAYMRADGVLDYWRAKGWPDLCHPVGSDDFACN